MNEIWVPRLVQVRTQILKENDRVARALRARFARAGVTVVSVVSSPGAGKTTLLARTLAALQAHGRVAALVGDLATDYDAQRLAATGAPVRQITTGTLCHLEAEMVAQALEGWDLDQLDWLLLENVGNLVCPATFDLGETLRVVLLSVTEGEDKPRKYPPIFHTADAVLVTKIDLAEVVGFDRALFRQHLAAVRGGIPVLELSARTGQGIPEWLAWLSALRRQGALEPGQPPLQPPPDAERAEHQGPHRHARQHDRVQP
jgi:hydrogenase nickel incorporation protein HypB